MTQQVKRSVKLLPIYKKAAISKTSAAVRVFLETNPDFKGGINIPIIKLGTKKDFDSADNDQLERLALDAECLKALAHKEVQESAQKMVSKNYSRVTEITVEFLENYAYAQITVSAATS